MANKCKFFVTSVVIILILIENISTNFLNEDEVKQSIRESATLRTALLLNDSINFSCLDFVNYLSQLFSKYFIKNLIIGRQLTNPLFSDMSTIYKLLVTMFRFIQIVLNDLKTQIKSIDCIGEQIMFCQLIDNNILNHFSNRKLWQKIVNQLNFFFGSQEHYYYNPYYAVWNSGLLFYKCYCQTC
jgi:hypothetical protein